MKKTLITTIIIAIFATVILAQPNPNQEVNCKRINLLPMPKSVNCGKQTIPFPDPCKILYHIKNSTADTTHIHEVIQHYQLKTFKCKLSNILFSRDLPTTLQGFAYTITITLKDQTLRSVFTTREESYTLKATKEKAELKAQTYVAFLRGIQTFLQAIQCPRLKYKNCALSYLPLDIFDEPAFVYRGLMIDTSRHFLPIHLIYETIDAMMYNKMSVLHWHIVDEDSFPLILESHPEIAKYASYSEEQTYTSQDARNIVKYARSRGVRVIPQLDTPGHAASWGLAPQNKGVACTFGTGFMGPLDVTLDKTYTLVKEVFAEILDIFPDPIVHLGGDQVVLTCLTNKTQFLAKQNIQQPQIQRHYRRKQHKIIMDLDSTRKPMYWMNSNNIQIQKQDVVHWWGGGMPITTNQVVLSMYGPFYLDMGVGNYLGVSYGNYQTWLDLYNQDIGRMIESYSNRNNVLGAEVCLWSELSNRYVHHSKIWIRTSSFAQRTWNTGSFNAKPDVLGRITAMERLMNRRGIPTAGATSQQCQSIPEFC